VRDVRTRFKIAVYMIDIYEYLDYRKYLKDIYDAHKSKHRYFSYRYITYKLGLKSTAYFSWILQGKRNLSQALILKFISIFSLNRKEAEYFEVLVKYNQAKTYEERQYYFERIALLTRSCGKIMHPEKYMFYEKWYYAAIREILCVIPVSTNYRELAAALIPPITPEEARKSIELLLDLSLIHKNAQGYYQKNESTITTGEKWTSQAILKFQRDTMDLGKQAIMTIPREERWIGTLTLSCSEDTVELIKKKLSYLQHDMEELVRKDNCPEAVFQCNVQLFPLTNARN
jgi:uncharacterized protein (TIGR02147 family)